MTLIGLHQNERTKFGFELLECNPEKPSTMEDSLGSKSGPVWKKLDDPVKKLAQKPRFAVCE